MSVSLRGALLLSLAALAVPSIAADDSGTCSLSLDALGRALFFDVNLSVNRSQSCATCHSPDLAFVDTRDNGADGAISLGADGVSLGKRNTPTITYAALVPDFAVDDGSVYRGGLFHDGRASDLATQAMQPIVNPLEMAMPDAHSLTRRLTENPVYREGFSCHFGAAVLSRPEALHRATGEAIAAFERTSEFAPFDSRYDRYLAGEIELSRIEEEGRVLFFSPLLNCANCHLEDGMEGRLREPFTNFEYFNIGVPVNVAVQSLRDDETTDQGLLENPQVDAETGRGKFRVPTLRNVALTAPYMHNGVFSELETAIAFYNKFLVRSDNPETGRPWQPAEIEETVALEELRRGQPMTPKQIRALAAFLRALTDRRYENLVQR